MVTTSAAIPVRCGAVRCDVKVSLVSEVGAVDVDKENPLRSALEDRLAEGADDGRLPALYGFAVSAAGHVQLAVYFDSGDDLTSAQSLVRSVKSRR